jgi:hypothetical protein
MPEDPLEQCFTLAAVLLVLWLGTVLRWLLER